MIDVGKDEVNVKKLDKSRRKMERERREEETMKYRNQI